MFPNMPAYYEVRGFAPNTDVTDKSELFRTARTWEEVEYAREEAENMGWTLISIREHSAIQK